MSILKPRVLNGVRSGVLSEVQLIDALQMIVENKMVYAVEFGDCEDYIDFEKPES